VTVDEQNFCDPQLGAAPSGPCTFALSHLNEALLLAQARGYTFLTCADYAASRPTGEKMIVMRHDVDALPTRALEVGQTEASIGIRSSFFFRVHSNEYNAFGYDTMMVIRRLAAMGHEIGLHAEPRDFAAAIGLDPDPVLTAGARMLEAISGVEVRGVACHNDITPDNNLHHFVAGKAASLGFNYEAYDREGLDLFYRAAYVTDGHYWRWRTYLEGELSDDTRCFCKHVADGASLLYVLVHPHIWYSKHFHLVTTGVMEETRGVE
jgi:hypothetical protein